MNNISRNSLITFPLFLLLLFIIFSPLIGSFPLAGSSEAREAHVIAVILREGEIILPTRNGIVPSKPPLFHWVGAGLGVLFSFFGLSLSSLSLARLTSLFAGIGLIFCTKAMSRFFLTLDKEKNDTYSSLLPEISVAILLSQYLFLTHLFNAKVDLFFSFLTVSAFLLLVSSTERTESRSTHSWIREFLRPAYALPGIGAACAVLAKGPLALVLLGLWWGTFRAAREYFTQTPGTSWSIRLKAVTQEVAWSALPRFFFIVPLFLAVGWYGVAFQRGGEAFLWRHLFFENLERFSGGGHINAQPWWFYLPEFIRATLPWGVVWIIGVRGVTRSLLSYKILSSMMLATLLFLSCASGKRTSYLVPLLPFLSVLCAQVVGCQWRKYTFLRTLERNGPRVIGWAAIVIGVIVTALYDILPSFSDWGRAWSGVVAEWWKGSRLLFLLEAGVLFILARKILQKRASQREYGLTVALLILLPWSFGQGIKGTLKRFSYDAATIAETVKDARVIVIKDKFEEYLDPVLALLPRAVEVVEPSSENLQKEHLQGTYLLTLLETASLVKANFSFCTEIKAFEEVQVVEKRGRSNAQKIILFYCGEES